jgi:hypothetical protein
MHKNWIAHHFQDSRFVLHRNKGGGDCLFYSISQATGYPVNILRRIASQMATIEEFHVKRNMYISAIEQLSKIDIRDNSIVRRQLLDDVTTYGWLKNVHTLEEYKKCLEKTGIWGDSESIDKLQKVLGVSFLILSHHQFVNGSENCAYVMSSDSQLPQNGYIMLAYYDGAHFELVTFAGKGIRKRNEWPMKVVKEFHL